VRTIVAGSRDFTDYALLEQTLDRHKITVLISGTARGADQLGERYANSHGIPVERFPANWNYHGKSAGFKRNMEMAQKAEALIAFWNGSPGTSHMIDIAKAYGLVVEVVKV
jgi:hypothetical protein